MKVVSINVGLPREVEWRGKTVRTSIFKEPVVGRVRVEHLNVEGDRQSDLTVHGGADKAGYVYPAEHYAFWCEELPGVDLPWGAFGENITTEGLIEDSIHIGDQAHGWFCPVRGYAASHALLQAGDPLRPTGHGEALPAKRPNWRLFGGSLEG